jgi:hypothetical protein
METQLCKYCDTQVKLELFRINRKKCKNCEKKYGRVYRNNEHGRQKAIIWSNNNKERHAKLQSEWAKNNREYLNNKYNARTNSDFNFKIKKACQRQLLFNLKKKNTTMKYLSCDINFFTKWLSYCFSKDMNINNHGSYWHLDHVIPVSLFNLESEEERFLCFHYLNYMPLLARDNISKQNKIIYSQLITHLNNIIEFHINNELSIDKQYFELLARHLTMPGISLEF